MIFERAARREFVQAAAGITVALLAILISTYLIRLLKDAAGGRIPAESVLTLLGYSIINYLPSVLTLTVFVSVLLGMSRVYRDSEMVVWLSCGQPLLAWIRPVMKFALPLIAGIALLSGYLAPWATYSTVAHRERLAARSEVSSVAPGLFQESKSGQRIFFVEALADDSNRVGNIFLASVQEGRLGVVVSREGWEESAPNGDHFVVLGKGKRYDVEPGSLEIKTMDFETYRFRSEDGAGRPIAPTPGRLPIDRLFTDSSRNAKAELTWRLGVPISAAILALMAIPLSFINPRAGRSGGLLLAILAYAVYNNLLSLSQSWVMQGRVSFVVGATAVHLLMLSITAFLFYGRISMRGFRFWRRA